MEIIWNATVSVLILAVGLVLIFGWLRKCGLPVPARRGDVSSITQGIEIGGRETVKIFTLSLLFRLAVLLIGFLLLRSLIGISSLSDGVVYWERWDAWHYVNLADLGYRGYLEDGQHLFLVFFPLYVWLTRLIRLLVGNTLLAGMAVSWLSYAGGCAYLYRLAALEYGRAAAWRAVLFLSVFPYAFFFGGVMTEGLFLLTTTAAFWHIRKHQWLAAGIWGALAAMTRMHGLLLIGAAIAELAERVKLFPFSKNTHRSAYGVLKKLPLLFLPLAGTVVYLALNAAVTGNPFAFVKMQEHWSQGFHWISDTLWYVLQNALSYGNQEVRFQIWIPTLILFPVFLGVLWISRRRHRGMYLLYGYCYLVLNYSLSWLLSAGRYLSCGLPFFLFAAVLTVRSRLATALLAGGMGALFVVNLALYLTGGQIM